jgi:myo-inositol-1-phosphate synthase
MSTSPANGTPSSDGPVNAHDGKLLVLTPGLGAVATTFIAGVEAVRRGHAQPIGSLSQMQTIRLGRRSEHRNPPIRDFVDLAPLDDLAFGAWDVFDDDAYEAAEGAGVLHDQDLEALKDFLHTVEPMPAAFDREYVKRLDGPNVKDTSSKRELAEALRADIRRRMEETGAERAVMVWCGSTEIYLRPTECHQSAEAFEQGLDDDDPAITPSQLYAYAALKEGVPYANGAPNLSADVPALEELAEENGVPIAGKDFKTGQTLMKTIMAPGLKTRMLGVKGWFSTNILGNRDGEVLEDEESFRSKEVTKASVLDTIFQRDVYPELYEELHHKVRINYYPPHGDAKEGWDNIDLFGWMGYPMQIKVNFLCRDSILAAPIVLDLALFLDLADRAGRAGIQEWLSFYFKGPQVKPGHVPEHDIFIQHFRLKNTLRVIGGAEPLTHLSENDPLFENNPESDLLEEEVS